MRDDQADKADGSGMGDSDGGCQRGDNIDAAPQADDGNPKRLCRIGAARKKIELPCKRQRNEQRRPQSKKHEGRIPRLGKVAHHPEQHALQFLVRRQREHQGNQGAASGGDDDASEQKPRLRPAAIPVCQAENKEHGNKRTGESRRMEACQPEAQQDGGNGADPGSAGDTENIRIGQRIT